MPSIEKNGIKIEVNEDGFMSEPEEWNPAIALILAEAEEHIDTLTDEHWAVVHYIRTYYEENNLAPMVRKMCQNTGFSLKRIYELFPSGPAKGACKVAGLARPTGCV